MGAPISPIYQLIRPIYSDAERMQRRAELLRDLWAEHGVVVLWPGEVENDFVRKWLGATYRNRFGQTQMRGW